MTNTTGTSNPHKPTHCDVLIIGAGFGGIRALYEMRKLGLSALVFESADDVGGTWHWNRYPGARTDSESWGYCYDFSKELQDEWDWKERMPTWDQVVDYMKHVVERFDLRKDIVFNTVVESVIYDESTCTWCLTTKAGEKFTCKDFISASGLLSVPYEPPFKGLASYEGEFYMTARWPKEKVEFAGKRVGIIGSGSTAVQVLPIVAEIADSVAMFQRTPNYVLPGRNYMLDDIKRQSYKKNYAAIWEQTRHQFFAFPMNRAGCNYSDVSYDEAERIFERGWEVGGFRYLFETFDDLLTNKQGNDHAGDFVRRKIRAIVADKTVADLLCPDYTFAAKRPPLGNFFYEAFNKPNVHLIDIKHDGIAELTPKGVRLESGKEFEFDIIICAIGFDAVTGALTAMDVRGKGGVTIKDKWAAGPQTHLGICVDGFPNMYMISGPQSPFANIPAIINRSVPWIGRLIKQRIDREADAVEPAVSAVHSWSEHMQSLLDQTLLNSGKSLNTWFLGANIPGKANRVLFYFGGAGGYFDEIEKELKAGFPGFVFATAREKAEEVV